MRWSYAGTITTQMVNSHAFGHFAVQRFINPAMRPNLSSTKLELPVTPIILAAAPQPAFTFYDDMLFEAGDFLPIHSHLRCPCLDHPKSVFLEM
jgi:hypothetical protein